MLPSSEQAAEESERLQKFRDASFLGMTRYREIEIVLLIQKAAHLKLMVGCRLNIASLIIFIAKGDINISYSFCRWCIALLLCQHTTPNDGVLLFGKTD
jgi:hypothetical protein